MRTIRERKTFLPEKYLKIGYSSYWKMEANRVERGKIILILQNTATHRQQGSRGEFSVAEI
ncbi:hypothetical protein IJ00_25540 [Calothrix sp. 336/3]|nr:hypothetical protein IJ00_25540 [Calothrix sp. 336/3]